MATDVKQALADIIKLKEDFENDLLLNSPEEAVARLIPLIMAMQPTTQNALNATKDGDDIREFFSHVATIEKITTNTTEDSIMEFAQNGM